MALETRFFLDDSDYSTIAGNTTKQSSLSIGYDIPRFCYHEKLSIAGNCRMCLLEVSYPRSLKPVASCALPIMFGMSVYTNTVMVKKAREGVLELLLLNHPLDCPVCDQAGECDLQDETSWFGGDRGRFYESKRAVSDKDCGPTIKTSMNRCIHCTKCVRFCNEVCGEPALGTLGRGEDMEIGTFIDETIETEFSGNLIDICPVGALTSKPYAFKARPWELRSFETVDVIDSLGSRIRIDIRGTEIMRILPSQSEDVNEDWITDRTRFSYDGLKIQRLSVPLVKLGNALIPVSWETSFRVSAIFLSSFITKKSFAETYLNMFLDRKTSVYGFFGELTDSETLLIFNDFFHDIGASTMLFQEDTPVLTDFRSNYLLNLPLDFIEKIDLCILIGLNLRLELPLLNLRIRKAFLYNSALIISFGFITNLTYHYFQQGLNINSFFQFLNGKSYASKCLVDSYFPLILVGPCFFKSFFFSFDFFKSLAKYSNIVTSSGWFGVSIVESRISLNAGRDLGLQYQGFKNHLNLTSSFVFMAGVENLLFLNEQNAFFFKVFQGHSGDTTAFASDVVFPGSTFIEKEALYTTLEGRIQKTKFLLTGPAFSRADWKIATRFRLYFFANFSSHEKFINIRDSAIREQLSQIEEVRQRLINLCPSFKVPEVLVSQPSHKLFNFFTYSEFPIIYRSLFYLYNFIFVSNTKNLYLNNVVTKNSKIMAICAGRYSFRQSNFWK